MNLHVISHFKVLIQLVLLVGNKTELASKMSEGMECFGKQASPVSSVVERSPCKGEIEGSNPRLAHHFISFI